MISLLAWLWLAVPPAPAGYAFYKADRVFRRGQDLLDEKIGGNKAVYPGFADVRWGMSLAQVRKVSPKEGCGEERSAQTVLLSCQLADVARRSYLFAEDKLIGGRTEYDTIVLSRGGPELTPVSLAKDFDKMYGKGQLVRVSPASKTEEQVGLVWSDGKTLIMLKLFWNKEPPRQRPKDELINGRYGCFDCVTEYTDLVAFRSMIRKNESR
jgi:hypothetical protein